MELFFLDKLILNFIKNIDARTLFSLSVGGLIFTTILENKKKKVKR